VAGSPWRFAVPVRRGPRPYTGPPPVLRGRGDASLIVRTARTKRAGVFAATVRFPTSGPWQLEVRVGARRFPLGAFPVDVPITPIIRDPYAIAALPDGTLLIGQRDGPILRADRDRNVSVFAPVAGVTCIALDTDGQVLVTNATRLRRFRLDGTETQAPVALGAEAAVSAGPHGEVFAAFYDNRVVLIDRDGHIAPFAGTGEAGYSGDGGSATLAKLFHPHDVAAGPEGIVFIADSENARIRRVDRSTGIITTYAEGIGAPIALAFGSDGALYTVGVARGSAPAGVWRTTASGSTLIAQGRANDVTVGTDGTIYVNQWEEKRIARVDRRTGQIRTILRGE
jgi:streptogramin lyase